MSTDSVSIVQAYFAAAPTSEAELLATVADYGVIDVPKSLPYGGLHRGHEGFRAALAGFGAAWRDVETHDLVFAVAGDQVVALTRMTAVAVTSGRPVEMRIAETFRIVAGKIAEVRPFYFDTAELVAALASG